MDEDKLKQAAGLLKEASDMLFSVQSSSTSSTSASNRSTNAGSIAETLVRARSMMQTSANTGLYRRLNRNERLRAATSTTKNKKEKKSKSLEKKPFEFALLRSTNSEESDDEDEVETLKKENIIERGMVVLNEDDDESSVRQKIVSSLKAQYNLLGPNDFEFVKVTQKRISVLRVGENTEYNYSVVKKLAGQGLLYLRMKEAFSFVLKEGEESYSDCGLDQSCFHQTDQGSTNGSTSTITHQTGESTSTITHQTGQSTSTITHQTGESSSTITLQRDGSPPWPNTVPHQRDGSPSTITRERDEPTHRNEDRGNEFYNKIIQEFPSSIVEPSEMLRYLQSKILRGRPLDVTNDASILIGDTNFITVDRDNILETTFEELRSVEDPRITFQVEFYGEQAQDSGGPRKEWIRLCNQRIKIKYFDHGLKEHLADDYFFVGQMAAIALLQNGQSPKYFPEDVLDLIFVSEDCHISPCILKLRQGLDSLGMHMFGRIYPLFLYLLRPSQNNARLTVKVLLHLLTPQFSEEGSNNLTHEKAVYGKFVKYSREVASGRRVTTLENILEFVTGTSEEPMLGFSQKPCIHFLLAEVSEPRQDDTDGQEPQEKKKAVPDFLPKSHTCSNTLHLPRGSFALPLPSDEQLFTMYDYAFKNSYFGVM